MVARISVKDALLDNFFYNENKVAKGQAACLIAANYFTQTDRINQVQRLGMLQNLASRNQRIKVNSVHVSLNFDPSENLTDDKLKEIAGDYMKRIGFGQQPYLVYRHFDAGHPHIHILSVKVGHDGKGLDTHLIGKRYSEPARRAIEEAFGLVKAEGRGERQSSLQPAYVAKVDYGKTESRKAIADVLTQVLHSYNYTTLAELNAVLGLYNIKADRCSENSRVFRQGGLLYRILDPKGQPVGVPIKASSFAQKPTLPYLECRFAQNKLKSNHLKKGIRLSVDRYFLNNTRPDFERLRHFLKKAGIDTIVRQNDKGFIYGLTYVDHKAKAVFNGSVLGKDFSAKAILERCGLKQENTEKAAFSKDTFHPQQIASKEPSDHNKDGILDLLTRSEHMPHSTPYELKKTRKKKRKKLSND